MKNLKHIFTSIMIAVLGLMPSLVLASSVTLAPDRITVHEGETFNINVGANADNLRQYTVRVSGSFTPKVIRLSNWKFNESWTAMRQVGYDSFDNNVGTFVRTGGYPGGFAGNANFGTATFVAGSVGQGIIILNSGTFIYDQGTVNSYAGANRVIVDVIPATKAVVVAPKLIDHKFDLALELPEPIRELGEGISTTLHLVNLSSKLENLSVPISLRIVDTDGRVVSDEVKNIDISGVSVVTNYNNPLTGYASGMYTIVAAVEMPNISVPAQSQSTFRIEPEASVVEAPDFEPPTLFDYSGAFMLILGLLFGMLLVLLIDNKVKEKAKSTIRKSPKKIVISE